MTPRIEGIEAGISHARNLLGDPRTATDVLTQLRSGDNDAEVAQAKVAAGASVLAHVLALLRPEQAATTDRVVELDGELRELRSELRLWKLVAFANFFLAAVSVGMAGGACFAIGVALVSQ